MSNKRSNSFRQAILQGNRRLCSKALLEEKGLNLSQRLIRHVAYETLPREIDRKWYYDSYTCCPPPWFMITVTLLEVRTRSGRACLGGGSGGYLRSRGEGWPASSPPKGRAIVTTSQALLRSVHAGVLEPLDHKDVTKIITLRCAAAKSSQDHPHRKQQQQRRRQKFIDLNQCQANALKQFILVLPGVSNVDESFPPLGLHPPPVREE